MTMREDGRDSSAMAPVLSRYPASANPGIDGAQGEEPVATITLGARITAPPAKWISPAEASMARSGNSVIAW